MGSGTLSRLSKGRHLMSSNETATSSFSRHLLQALLGAQARTVRFASLAPLVQNLLNRAIMIVHVCCSLACHGWLVTNRLWSHCCGDRSNVSLVALWVLSAELSLLLAIEWLQTVVEDKYQVVIISSYSKLFVSPSGQYEYSTYYAGSVSVKVWYISFSSLTRSSVPRSFSTRCCQHIWWA